MTIRKYQQVGLALLVCMAMATVCYGQAAAVAAPPSVDVDWGPNELRAFFAYFVALEPGEYPHFGDESEALFQKFIDSLEQEGFSDTTIPISQRMIVAGGVQQGLASTMGLYNQAMLDGADYATEVASLMGELLGSTLQIGVLFEEALATTDPSDDNYERLDVGFQRAQGGMGQVLGGVILSIHVTEQYTVADRMILCQAVLAHGPGLFAMIPPEAQETVITQVETVIENTTHDGIRDGMEQFLAEVSESE